MLLERGVLHGLSLAEIAEIMCEPAAEIGADIGAETAAGKLGRDVEGELSPSSVLPLEHFAPEGGGGGGGGGGWGEGGDWDGSGGSGSGGAGWGSGAGGVPGGEACLLQRLCEAAEAQSAQAQAAEAAATARLPGRWPHPPIAAGGERTPGLEATDDMQVDGASLLSALDAHLGATDTAAGAPDVAMGSGAPGDCGDAISDRRFFSALTELIDAHARQCVQRRRAA